MHRNRDTMIQGRRPHECVKLEAESRMMELHQGPSGQVGQCPTIPSQEEARKDSSLDVQGAHDMDFSLPTCKMNFCCFHQMFGEQCLVTTTLVNECTIVPALSVQVPEIQKNALDISPLAKIIQRIASTGHLSGLNWGALHNSSLIELPQLVTIHAETETSCPSHSC